MCGIAGIISSRDEGVNMQNLQQMAEAIRHRGPDGEGFWINASKRTGLAHRRLSIIDLSDRASQPMHYMNRYTIVYNGELYNYVELRNDLKKLGYRFATDSDTEVILAAYDCYKIKCLQHFDGMFSFAIWDEAEQILIAARDRFGEKPFYYFEENGLFFFGSEMKALWAAGIEKRPDFRMILNYLTLGQLQNPSDKSQTFYKNISSLPPSHYLMYHKEKLSVKTYWRIDRQYVNSIGKDEAKELLHELFSISVERRLRSDVAIGSSLSGGLDSSSILYYIRQFYKNDIKTFSAVFPGFEKDESEYIQNVSRACNAINYTVTPSAYELMDDFNELMFYQEEPFPSSSIYAQYRVYKLAKENGIKVLLDGQGADELLAGYHRYLHWFLQEKLGRYQFRSLYEEHRMLIQKDIHVEWGIKNYLAAFLPSHVSLALEQKQYNQVAENTLVSKEMISLLKGSEWEGIHKPVVTKLNDILHFNVMEMGLEELLRFADRNSMAHGCEVRLPFLQHELVKFIFSLPSHFKISGGYTKKIFRELMDKKLPDTIVWRTDKIGFEPPQKKWMAETILYDAIVESKKCLVDNGILRPEALQQKPALMEAHDDKNYDWRYLCVANMISR
ncbi:MAG: asparagine synthase (glutamine-hydrolyzing) [Ferruginibacter sp.]|nr:asparagine synthase (glutamine-hydrolyzing) [Ferruginibacter sp.]